MTLIDISSLRGFISYLMIRDELRKPIRESRHGKQSWRRTEVTCGDRSSRGGDAASPMTLALGVLRSAYLISYPGLSLTFLYFEKYNLTSELSKLT